VVEVWEEALQAYHHPIKEMVVVVAELEVIENLQELLLVVIQDHL
tara:strand:- start:391 stop:525 length:135 start_codon:yes stop_codon:yes gene_type:complete